MIVYLIHISGNCEFVKIVSKRRFKYTRKLSVPYLNISTTSSSGPANLPDFKFLMLFFISLQVKFKFNSFCLSCGKHIRPGALDKFKLPLSSPARSVSGVNKVEKYVNH